MNFFRLNKVPMKNSLNQNLNQNNQEVLNWDLVQEDFKTKFGKDVFESWLKKMDLLETNVDYLLISVPTRFIRDWITSRYLDNVIQVIKSHKKQINRIEFKIKSFSTTVSEKNKLNEIFSFTLFSLISLAFKSLFLDFSAILNSILIMSFLYTFIICRIWSRYLEVIQSLINLVGTDNNK